MKKTVIIFSAIIMCALFCSCGNKEQSEVQSYEEMSRYYGQQAEKSRQKVKELERAMENIERNKERLKGY